MERRLAECYQRCGPCLGRCLSLLPSSSHCL
jgi:hypothetical protein